MTVIQENGLTSFETRLSPSFSLYQIWNMNVVIHSFDMFELLILPLDYGLSFWSFPRSSVFFVILLFILL